MTAYYKATRPDGTDFRTGRALRATSRRMVAALTPSYAVAEAPPLWGGPDAPLLWDERLGRSQGGEL